MNAIIEIEDTTTADDTYTMHYQYVWPYTGYPYQYVWPPVEHLDFNETELACKVFKALMKEGNISSPEIYEKFCKIIDTIKKAIE